MGLKAETKDLSPETQECVDLCTQVIEAAKITVKELESKSALQEQLLQDRHLQIEGLTRDLNSARVWYRAPELVIPTALFLGLVIGVQVKK